MQFYRVRWKIFIQMLQRKPWSFVPLELPAPAAHCVEAIASPLKDSARLRSALFSNEKVQIKLRSKFRIRDRTGPERQSFQVGIPDIGVLKLPLDRFRFSDHAAGSLTVINKVQIKAREHRRRQQITEI